MQTQERQACNPLTDDHCQVIDNVLQGCAMNAELLRMCQEAGLPGIDGYVKDNNRLTQLAQGVKSVFFPGKP